MGIGVSLATGFVKELNLMDKERRASAAKVAEDARADAVFRSQEFYKAQLQRGTDIAKSKRELEAAKRTSVSDALQQAIEDGTITDAGLAAVGKGLTSFDPSWIDLSKSSAAIDAAASTLPVLGEGGSKFTWNLVGDLEYGSGGSPYKRSQVLWDTWDSQLQTEEGFQAALDYFQNDATARNNLEVLVNKNENALRVGNINAQKKAGVEETGLKYVDLSEEYGNASRLFDELGFKNVEELSLKEIAGQTIDVADDEEAILFPTRDTASGGMVGGIFIPMKKTDVQHLSAMASRTGYDSAQHLVAAFNYRAGERPEDMTDQEFAAQQNDVLLKAIKLEQAGYGDMLANPALMDGADAANLYGELQKTFKGDKQGMAQAVSLLVATPEGTFVKTRKYRYSGNVNQKAQAVGTGAAFVERVTGLKADDFNEGLKAQTDAVDYLDRLIELEDEIGEQVGTGWIRDSAAFFGRFGIQISQAPQAVGALFGANEDFAATTTGTSQADLQATIKEVIPGIDLANISEAEAIRLTLAAKMARAIDPSGRLSNQDFEIQLRRLGDASFTTPGEIKRKLNSVKKDFEADLEFKNMLKRVMDDQSQLTPQVARTVQAHIKIRELEEGLYGTTGRDVVVQQQQDAPEDTAAVKITQSSKTWRGQPVYIGTDPQGNVRYYLDPEGTTVVPTPREIK